MRETRSTFRAALFSVAASVLLLVTACEDDGEEREQLSLEECHAIKEEEGLLKMPSECDLSDVIQYGQELAREEYDQKKEEEALREQEEEERQEILDAALEEVSVDNINENHPEVLDFWRGLDDEEIEIFGRTYLGYKARGDGAWHFHTQPIGIEMAQLYYGACIDIDNAVTIVELEGPFSVDNYIDMQYVYCNDEMDNFDTLMELKEEMEEENAN